MSTLSIILSITLPLLSLVFSVFVAIKTMSSTHSGKKAFFKHLIALTVCLVMCFAFCLIASAAETDEEPIDTEPIAVSASETTNDALATGLSYIGAGIAIGLAAIGAGIALASGAPAAIGAVAEDPKSFGKSMIFVALGEAVAIYGFIIAFLIILPTLS